MVKDTYVSPNETPKAVLLLIAQLAASAAAVIVVLMQTLRVAGCDDACNYVAVTIAYQGTLAVAVVAFLASLVVVAVRGSRRRPSWWAPVAGIAVVTLTAGLAVVAIHSAT